MRRSDLYAGLAAFIALALSMPLAALEPVGAGAMGAGACGSKLAAVCDRAA